MPGLSSRGVHADPPGASRARAGQDRAQGPNAGGCKEAIGHGVRAKRSKYGASALMSLRRRRPAMQRSSDTIGTIAAAWQRHKPSWSIQKNLWSGQRSDRPAQQNDPSARTAVEWARYRAQTKQHEIATVQTTSIEETSGIVRLSRFWPCLRGMDCFGLANLSNQRDSKSTSDGCGADLCAPIRPVHTWALPARTIWMRRICSQRLRRQQKRTFEACSVRWKHPQLE